MINPNRTHRAKGTITKIRECHFEPGHEVTVLVKGRSEISGWVNAKGLNVGDTVNVQAQFSICLDRYTLSTVRKPRNSI